MNKSDTIKTPKHTRPSCMTDNPTHYCPGCGHGIVHRILGEVIDELHIRERTIGIAPVGCAVLAYDYLDIDWTEAAHGRPPAVATGLKRVNPDNIVFTYQGDGDLASIGMAETIHCANRGENITVLFLNNTVYGMTQGQMAPTTLLGQKTTTTPRGRDVNNEGPPMRMCELLEELDATRFLARCTVTSARRVRETKRMLRKAFQNQINGVGFSFVEILSPCPTYWRLSPRDCGRHIEEVMAETFPLGIIKDAGESISDSD